MTTDVTASAGPAEPASDPSSRPRSPAPAAPRLPVPLALVAALLAAAALVASFPPYDRWWLAPVGVGLLAVAVHRQRVRVGAALGGLTGLAFFTPLLAWTNLEIGYPPWLILSALQAAYLAVLGAATAYLSPVADRWRWSWPLLTAVAWVAQEALRSRTPFGGFPWGRLAFSQGDSWLLALAALGGAPLVTFAVALAGGLLAAGAWRLGARGWRAARGRVAAGGALVLAGGAVMISGLAVPMPVAASGGETANVAFVQGNVPRLGLDFNAQRRAVLDNHVDATIALAGDVAAGRQPQPDLVVWPENSSDIDPLRDEVASERIDEAANAVGAPILVGAARREGDTLYNTGLVWNPGTGPATYYAKQHPVPFAEYLPMRSLVLPVARAIVDDPDDIWLLGESTGFDAGDEPGVMALGPALIGNAICFEVAYDGLVRETVVGGAQLLTVQTNNATFNEAEARQQLAMVRLRAVEHGRESLMVSTVGISGFVGVDGRVYGETGFFTQDVQVRTLALTQARTPATVVGAWPELVMAGAALGALALAVAWRRGASRKVEHGRDAEEGSE